jgi:hypothetical protein
VANAIEGILGRVPDLKRPDVRPQLGELLEWYREVLARIEGGVALPALEVVGNGSSRAE